MKFLAARIAGLILIAAALAALVIDGTRLIASSTFEVTSFRLAWTALSPTTFASAGEFVRKTFGAWLWDPVIGRVLGLPAFAVLGLLGGGLVYLGRRRRSKKAAT